PVRLLREHLAEGVIELVRHSGDPVRRLQPHYPASPILQQDPSGVNCVQPRSLQAEPCPKP
ncbi:hypothetical protein, partial [Mesorhizobium sp. A623]